MYFNYIATPGSGYVLLHHVMGELEGIRGAWGYPEGGMGAVSDAIAKSAESSGAEIVVESIVQEVNKLSTYRNKLHTNVGNSCKFFLEHFCWKL